jgi:hypothetical protein
MKTNGTISQAYGVLASLIRGAVYDRNSLAETYGVTVASADRYIRELTKIPGVIALRFGRRLTVRWSFAEAIREAGL